MSKSTLSSFKSEVSSAQKSAWDTESRLSDLEKQVYSAMNDAVGDSAQASIKSIKTSFSYNMDGGYKGALNMANALDSAYSRLDTSLTNADSIIARARAIKRELGDL